MADYTYNAPRVDFVGALSSIGNDIKDYRERGQLSSALSALGPNASWEDRAQAIMKIDPQLGVKLLAVGQKEGMTDYQAQSLDLQRQRLAQSQAGGGLTPYQQQSLGIQNQRLDLAKSGAEKLPPNTAGALAMMQTGQKELDTPVGDTPDSPTARAVLSDPTQWKQGQQAQSFMPEVMSFFGQTDVVNAQAAVRTNVEAALRMMTGAAAPEQEVERYAAMFTPSWNDTKARAEAKLRRLDEFTKNAQALASQGRGNTGQQQGIPARQPIDMRTVPPIPGATQMDVGPGSDPRGAYLPQQQAGAVSPPVTTDMPQIPAAVGKARQAMQMGHSPEAIAKALIADGVPQDVVQQIMQAMAQGPGQ